jgi:hypothetical protein
MNRAWDITMSPTQAAPTTRMLGPVIDAGLEL